jgi:PAT family beta-lactamase induction signal transducer AmpG
MLLLGFSSGLVFPLVLTTLSARLRQAGIDRTTIGLFSLVGLMFSLKFFWSPIVDRLQLPFLYGALGRRRSWMLLSQCAIVAGLLSMALADPGIDPVHFALLAALTALGGSTQDIAIDAWRIEVFPERRQGVALAAYVWGYRVAMLVSMSGVVAVSVSIGWHRALMIVAVMIAAGTLVTLAANREDAPEQKPARGLRHAVIDPVRSFLSRPSSLLVLGFVALFKLGEAMAGIMTAPFYRHLTFDRAAIAATGPFSLGATLGGITLGGWLVARIGVGRALLWTGWAQTVAMAMYVVLSLAPGQHAVLYATVTTEAFAQGLADAAFLTFLSALCAREFAATQYALLSSVPQLAIHTIGAVSGVMAASLGWTLFYTVCMAGALPGMALMLVLLRRDQSAAAPERSDGHMY